MNKIRIMVVDDSITLVSQIKEYFSSHAVIEVTRTAKNGAEALQAIESNNDFDIVLLDMVMPDYDGFYLLEQLEKKDIKKDIIVLSTYTDDSVIRRVSDYGIKYYVLKPFELSKLESAITSCAKVENTKDIKAKDGNINYEITKLLHQLGVPSHIKGYLYIRDGIRKIYKNNNYLGAITKELYPEIATEYETTASRVERAIRHAIEVSWNRGNYDLMEEIFGQSYSYDKSKPTNSEFIATLADKLKLDSKRILINI